MADYDTLLKRAQWMRNHPTESERHFKRRLVGANIKFRSQVVIEPYIVDFLIGELIVEIDGSVHHKEKAKEYDSRRDACLRRAGFRIVRVPNEQVRKIDLNRFKPGHQKKAKKEAQKRAARNLRRAERKEVKQARLKAVAERNSRPRLIKNSATQ